MFKKKIEQINKIVDEFKPISREETEPSFVKVKAYDYTLNNGQVQKREQIIKGSKEGSAVIIVPYIGNNLLLVIEPRVFTKKGVCVGFPAGYIEDNETPLVVALRELQEETGLVPERLVEVDSFYQDEGCSSAFNHIFIAYNCKKKYEQHLDEGEYIKYMEFTENEADELEKLGYINSSNSKLALARVRERRIK